MTTAAISKRLAHLEERLGVRLLNRTTRRTSLTAEGEIYLAHARRILADISDMEQLQLTVNPPSLAEDTFDMCIRFGEPPDARVMARKIAPNRRLLCASPAYLALHGAPKVPSDLTRHNCLGIRQGDDAYGSWRLTSGKRTETVKVRGNLSTTDGEIAVDWALDGHGILMRAEWDIAKYVRSGRLVQVLEGYETPPADIHLVYPQHLQMSARVRAFVDFTAKHFEKSSTLAAGLVTRW